VVREVKDDNKWMTPAPRGFGSQRSVLLRPLRGGGGDFSIREIKGSPSGLALNLDPEGGKCSRSSMN
jgi:hypothetical protein